jgi:hypothetical protein
MQIENNTLLYKRNATVDRFHPNPEKENALMWKCNTGRLCTDNGTEVIAYQYLNLPHHIFKNGSWKDIDKEMTFNGVDLKSNCFGFVFANNEFWIDPIEDYKYANKNTIDLILENDGYKKINQPIGNSIAVFIKNGLYTHTAKTLNGNTWVSKGGINKVSETMLDDEIKRYGEAVFYKKK